jgi:hypothetical protein
MTMMGSSNVARPDATSAQLYGSGGAGASRSANLGDILERVLDKGLVIAGDIQVNLLDIELLTIKLRLIVASLDTAREVGINWWEDDPWLNADAARRAAERGEGNGHSLTSHSDRNLEAENERLRDRVRELESAEPDRKGDARSKRRDG